MVMIMMKFYICGLFPMAIILAFVEIASAQISINSNGNVAIKTETVEIQRGLNIECSTATNCGNTGNRWGIYSIASNAYSSWGIYSRAQSAYAGMGVWGVATGSSINYGVHGSAESGSNNFGGYFTHGIYVSGGITQASDERLKTNIRGLTDENMLARIIQLRPVRYDYLNGEQLRQHGMPVSHTEEGEQLGLLAQEVEQVFPELVREVVHLLDEDIDLNAEMNGPPETVTTKGINYNGMIVALIAAVQEQQKQIEELQRQLNQVQGQDNR